MTAASLCVFWELLQVGLLLAFQLARLPGDAQSSEFSAFFFLLFFIFFLIFFCKNHPRELQPRPLSPQTLFQSSCVPLIEWRYQPKVMSSLQVELLEKMGVCFVLLFTKLNKAAAHFSLIL